MSHPHPAVPTEHIHGTVTEHMWVFLLQLLHEISSVCVSKPLASSAPSWVTTSRAGGQVSVDAHIFQLVALAGCNPLTVHCCHTGGYMQRDQRQ